MSHGCILPAYCLLDGWCPAGPLQGQVVITKDRGRGQETRPVAVPCPSLGHSLPISRMGLLPSLPHVISRACNGLPPAPLGHVYSALDTPAQAGRGEAPSPLPHPHQNPHLTFHLFLPLPRGTPGNEDIKALATPVVPSPSPAS